LAAVLEVEGLAAASQAAGVVGVWWVAAAGWLVEVALSQLCGGWDNRACRGHAWSGWVGKAAGNQDKILFQ
jgi:hypothetical protein